MTQRVAPHDLEAERAVIGSVLLDAAECLPTAAAVLEAEHFFSPAHLAIWLAICVCAKAGGGLDDTMVRGELQRAGKLDLADESLTESLNRLPDTRNIEAHALTIRNLAVVRDVASKASAIANRAYSGQIGDLTEFLDEAEHALPKVCEGRAAVGELHHIDDIVVEVFERVTQQAEAQAEAKAAGKVVAAGHSTGFEDIDRYIAGLEDGNLYIVAGRPGMGKTAFVLNVLRNVSGATQEPAVFFSLEMPRAQLGARLLASESLVDSDKLRFATMKRDDWPRLASAAGSLNGLPIYIDDKTTNIDDICRIARRKKREAGGLSMVALDYIQLCRVSGRFDNREQQVSYVSRTLKGLAKELEIPVVALAQLNRGVETRGAKDKRPLISDLRESGAIEQDADTILFIYRDEVYNPESPDRGLAEIIIGKQRGGATGTVKTVFRKEYTRFESYDGGHSGDQYGEPPPYEARDHTAERYP